MQLDYERIKNGTFSKRLNNAYTEMVKAGSVDEERAKSYKSIYESESVENILNESEKIFREPIEGLKFYESLLTESIIPLHRIPFEIEKFESFVEDKKDKMSETQRSMYESSLERLKAFAESRRNEINLSKLNLTGEREVLINSLCEAVRANDDDGINNFFNESCEEDRLTYGYYVLPTKNPNKLNSILYSDLPYRPEMESSADLYKSIVKANIYSSYLLEDAGIQEDLSNLRSVRTKIIVIESGNLNYLNVIGDIFSESVLNSDLIYESGEDLMTHMFSDDEYYDIMKESNTVKKISNIIKSHAVYECFMDLLFNEYLSATDDNIKSSVIKNFVGTDKISEARTILESTVADYEQKMSEYFSESENDPSFFEYTRRGEATPVIRDNVGTLRETPIEGKKKDKKKNDQNNHPSHNDEDEDEEDDTDEDEDGDNEDDEEDLDDDLKDDLHESDNKKSSKPNHLKKPTSQPASNQQQSSTANTPAVKPQESLTKKIQNKAMDTEMNMNKAKGKADEAFTSVKNAAKAVASIPAGIVNGIQTKIKEWNEWDENKKKERILDSGYRSSVYKLMKTAIMYRATWQINKIWVVWLYIIRHTPIYQDRNKRIKNELLVELDTEIQVTEEKIQDASSNGDQQQKYQLMRLKKKLEAEKIRVVTNSKRI